MKNANSPPQNISAVRNSQEEKKIDVVWNLVSIA
jgi:hypothetical protein